MITENIRKITAGAESKALAKVSFLAKALMIVGAALILGILINEVEGVLQQEFLKALSIVLGLCILPIMYRQQTSNH